MTCVTGRRRRWRLLPVAPLLLVASCSGGGDDGLQAQVDAIRLEVDDLGDGWRQTGAESPGADDDTDLLERCVTDDLADDLDDAIDAESETISFQQIGELGVPSDLRVSSVALDDEGVFEALHDLLRGASFAECFGAALVELLRSAADRVEVGAVEAAAGSVDGDVESTTVVAPLTVEAAGEPVELTVRLTVLSNTRFGAYVAQTGPVGELDAEAHAEWGRLLAERMPPPE